MTGGKVGMQMTYKAKVTIARYLAVKLSAKDECDLPGALNALPLGVVWLDQGVAGYNVAVDVEGGYMQVLAGATINVGDEVIVKADGTVIDVNDSGITKPYSANILGIAESAGATGDIVTIREEKKSKYITA